MELLRVSQVILVFFCASVLVAGENETDRSKDLIRLRTDLFDKYERYDWPGSGTNDDQKRTIMINGWIRMIWTDSNLKWDPKQYGGIESINVDDTEVWVPNVHIWQSVNLDYMDHYGYFPLPLFHDGQIIWAKPVTLSVLCDIDLAYWPFDKQKCNIYFAPWSYTQDYGNITNEGRQEVIEHDEDEFKELDKAEWKITSLIRKQHSLEIPFEKGKTNFTFVIYKISVSRRGLSYYYSIVLPTTGSVLLTLSLFWFNFRSIERLLIGGINIFLIYQYITNIFHRLPAIGKNPPLLLRFQSEHLIMVVVALLYTVAARHICSTGRLVPWAIKSFLKGPFGKFLLLENNQVYSEDTGGILEACDGEKLEPKKASQWSLAVSAIDRIFFVVYLIVFISLSIRFTI